MKPFNFEEAKQGKPIQLRDGTPVKFIAHVPEAFYTIEKLVILVDGIITTYPETGVCSNTSNKDLVMATQKKSIVRYTNIYKNDNKDEPGYLYQTKEEAFSANGWCAVFENLS